jgi:DNA mismatch repair protein MutL
MRIRRLPEGVVNRIAAGEVIERPASVVKELVENALDAGAGRIEVWLDGGGRSLIAVEDDGAGMSPDELPLALERHATSKLDGEDLVRIRTLGFRGEALPSIGAVSRMRIATRTPEADAACELAVEGGALGPLRGCAGARGTRIEVADLFYRTPARLKFLRSERAEAEAAADIIRRLALAQPAVGFNLRVDGRETLDLPARGGLVEGARETRMRQVMGRGTLEAGFVVEAERGPVRLFGFAGLPTAARTSSRHQYLFVNSRPVQDRLLKAALRAAYSDLLFHDRQPVACLYLELPPELVDVNVHPTKAEVRFAEPAAIRGLVVGALKRALAEQGHRSAMRPPLMGAGAASAGGRTQWAIAGFAPADAAGLADAGDRTAVALDLGPPLARSEELPSAEQVAHPLGAARAQLHANYIVAETAEGMVIVDQHAAHERLVYERLKTELEASGVRRQALLVPEVVELEPAEQAALLGQAEDLEALGLVVERFGEGAVIVREVPAALGAASVAALLRDVAGDLEELGSTVRLREAIDRVLGVMACHHSVRAGRRLGVEEMNALLRDIESGRFTGQCIHGRPTYIELKLDEIERLFARR